MVTPISATGTTWLRCRLPNPTGCARRSLASDHRRRSTPELSAGSRPARVRLLGQVVGEVDSCFYGFGQVETVLRTSPAGSPASTRRKRSWRRGWRRRRACSRRTRRCCRSRRSRSPSPEPAHAPGGIQEPPRGAQPEGGIGPGDRGQLTAVDRLVNGEQDDSEPGIMPYRSSIGRSAFVYSDWIGMSYPLSWPCFFARPRYGLAGRRGGSA